LNKTSVLQFNAAPLQKSVSHVAAVACGHRSALATRKFCGGAENNVAAAFWFKFARFAAVVTIESFCRLPPLVSFLWPRAGQAALRHSLRITKTFAFHENTVK
jgi:hypothetical protein